MEKNSFCMEWEVGRGRLRGLMWGVVFLLSVLISPLSAGAEECSAIDYNIATIAAGESHTLGIREDGTVIATGDGYHGQLNVSGWTNIKSIATADSHTVGLREDGTVVASGDNRYGQLNVSGWTNIKSIAAGGGGWGAHSVGLREDGTVVATGDNRFGQLNVSGWTNIKAIAAGAYFTVGIKEDGTVVITEWQIMNGPCFGVIIAGFGCIPFPRPDISSWTNIKAIAAQSSFIIGLKEDGTMVIADPRNWWTLPIDVSGWTNIKTIAAGMDYAVGIKEDGTVVAAGRSNSFGQLNVSIWSNIKAIAAARSHTVGLREDGRVVGTGSNYWGQLNVGHWTNIRQPACLNDPPVANAGPDQTIECAGPSGASVILNGSASSDQDGDTLTYNWTWPGGSSEGVSPTVPLPLGTTVVTLTVRDGTATATDTVNITVQDKTPPVTTATGGSNNWYNANVISAFSATDSCSGVKEIHYTVNGTETAVSGDSASLTLTTDGTYNIAYYSIDNAGNAESPNSMAVKIDKMPPVLNLSTDTNTIWPPNHKMTDVLIGGNATDATSGIASVAFTVTDEYGTIQPSIRNFNTAIQLEAWREGTDKDGRHYTITAVAADAAGNKTTTSTTVLVPHDQGKK